MNNDAYSQPKRAFSGGFDKRFVLTAADVTQNLIEPFTTKPIEEPRYHAIHVQRLVVVVMSGSANKVWQFGNAAPDATLITPPLDMSTSGSVFEFDFGPQGVRLHPGRPLEVFISAAGAAADIYVEGFQEMVHAII
jgi:hypothetical protein